MSEREHVDDGFEDDPTAIFARLREVEIPAELLASVSDGVAAALDLQDVQRAFSHLAARLSPKQRAAFVLREIEGLETAEVARILDVTESTVRNHLLQARRTLQAGLEREYPSLVPKRRGGDRGGE